MTSVFCDIDDFCLIFEPERHKQLICNANKPPVTSKLSLSEIMTIIIHFHQSPFLDFKHYYLSLIVKYKSDCFPNLVSYNRFVELMKQALIPLTVYLKTQCMGQPTGLSFIDSTPIVVCDNHRINSHKVFSEEAKRGKTSTGWKFGFKLHLVINHLGEILWRKIKCEWLNLLSIKSFAEFEKEVERVLSSFGKEYMISFANTD